MQAYLHDAIELLQALIATPSTSREEGNAANVLAGYLEKWGLPYGRECNNFWVGCPDWDNNRPTIMLNAHIDTVKPVASWSRNPYEPSIEGDQLYGLGSNDCGGGLVALLQTYRIMLHKPRSYNLLWVASAEEEISGQNGFSRVLPKLPTIDLGIVGEPTGMQPAIAERGLMVIDGYADGISGHAARDEGVNAIYEALDDLVWLRDYQFRKESPLLGTTKLSVTVIEAGTQHNVVPDKLHFIIDVRTNEFYQNEYLYEFLRKKMSKCRLEARSFRLHSSSIPESHPFVRKCLSMGMRPFGSPTLSDQALMPFTTLKLGPGDSSRSHSADEFIRLSEISHAIETYVNLLTDFHL